VHTVVETPGYLRAAAQAGLSAQDRHSIVNFLSRDPDSGDVISGSGGCRKLRFGRGSKGKSGGVRIITFFSGTDLSLFLITVFAKNERSDLSKAEANALAVMTKKLVETYSVSRSRSTR